MKRMQRKVSFTPKDAEKVVSESSTRRTTRAGLSNTLKEECEFPDSNRRKSGRLAKLAIENSETSMTDDYNSKAPELGENGSLLDQEEDISDSEDSVRKRKKGKQPMGSSSEIGTQIKSLHQITFSNDANSALLDKEKMAHSQHDTEHERQKYSSSQAMQSITEKFKALVEASPEPTRQVTMGTNTGMEVNSEPPHTELVHESLSRLIGGICSPSPSTSSVNATRNSGFAIDLTELFLKTSSRWKQFESEDVFQRMPQQPHFQPLEHINESRREREALVQMMNFSAVVEKVSMLQFSDVDNNTTNDILEELEELETHGFNVVPVHERVILLLSLKEKYETVMGFINEFNSQLEVEEAENNNSDEHTSELEKKISELQEKVRNLKEELLFAQTAMLSAGTAKKNRDDRIARLKARKDEIEKETKAVFQEFLIAATSPLL